jgi:hypothetical protein
MLENHDSEDVSFESPAHLEELFWMTGPSLIWNSLICRRGNCGALWIQGPLSLGGTELQFFIMTMTVSGLRVKCLVVLWHSRWAM